MIEKIHGENIAVYKHRDQSAAAGQFELIDQSRVEPGKSENTGGVPDNRSQDLLIISPDYHAVKHLTETAALLAEKVEKLNQQRLPDIRRKIQDGFYLTEEVLTAAAEEILAREMT